MLSLLSVRSRPVFSCPARHVLFGPHVPPAPPSELVAALPPLLRLQYCFVIRRTPCSVTAGASTARCAPLPRLRIPSIVVQLPVSRCTSPVRSRCRLPVHSTILTARRIHNTPTSPPVAPQPEATSNSRSAVGKYGWVFTVRNDKLRLRVFFHSTLHGSGFQSVNSRHTKKIPKRRCCSLSLARVTKHVSC